MEDNLWGWVGLNFIDIEELPKHSYEQISKKLSDM